MLPDAQAWAQPMTLEGRGQNVSFSAEYMEESVSQLTEAVGEDQSLQALGLTLNGERVAQHALVSGLLALEVLVTGSLPAAMLTQVWNASESFLKCSVALPIPSAYSTGNTLLADTCHKCHSMPKMPCLTSWSQLTHIALDCPFSVLCGR